MDNKTQNKQNNGGDESQGSPKYDFFISYRHLSSDNQNNSVLLARNIAQDLKAEGFKVFFDCSEITPRGKEFELIKDSKCILVLITEDSLNTVKQFSFKNADKKKSSGNGHNFARELHEIEKRLKSNTIRNEDVLLLNIDKQQKTIDILNTFKEQGYEHLSQTEVVPFLTGNFFTLMIKYLSHRINGDEETKYYESIKEYKTKSEKYKTWSVLAIVAAAIAVVFGLFNVFWDKESPKTLSELRNEISSKNSTIDSLRDSLSKYENEFIVFAGGGTVQRYLQQCGRINVNDYPFSKYVHMPSASAWSLLWDDVNEKGNRRYCPVVLSAGEINTDVPSIIKFKENDRRIASYQLGNIPLMVQVYDKNKTTTKTDTINITLDSLKGILKTAKFNRNEYEIWTTTENSGTYLEYKKLVYDSFDLDGIVNNQGANGTRLDFSPANLTGEDNKTKIVLANKHYFYTEEEPSTIYYVVGSDQNGTKKTIPLYIYVVARRIDNTSTCEILPEAEKFLDTLGWNTSQTLPFKDNQIIIPLDPKKNQ